MGRFGLLCVLAAAAACGLGDKAALEDAITAAPGLLEEATVSGTVTVESRIISVPSGAGVPGVGGAAVPGVPAAGPSIPEGGATLAERSADFILDLETEQATLTLPDATSPSVIFQDLVSFGRRNGVPETDARPWVRLDLAVLDGGAGELDPLTGDSTGAINAMYPGFMVDLAAGSLTGSIKEVGPEDVGDVATTRYDVNVALDKAYRDVRRSRYPEDRRETLEELFAALGVSGNVHPASVWLDADGRLRRFRVELNQEPLRDVKFALAFDLELTSYDATFEVTTPTPQEVLGVDTVLRFISTVSVTAPIEEQIPTGLGIEIPEGFEDLVPGLPTDDAPADPAAEGEGTAEPAAEPAP